MSKARETSTPAIVIRVVPFGETSQVVHLATPARGLVAALVKGAHRPGPEFQGGLTLGAAGTAHLVSRRGAELDLLRRFRTTEDLRGLRGDLGRFYGACYVLELLRAWTRADLPADALVKAAWTTLRALARTAAGGAPGWVVWFEARALAATGHQPRLDACAVCDEALGGRTVFSAAAGGLAHGACAPPEGRVPVPPDGLAGLRRLYGARLRDLAREPLGARAVRCARAVHDVFVPYVLERRPAALRAVAHGA